MSAGDNDSSRHLAFCAIFLTVIVIAILTTAIILKNGDKYPEVAQAKALKSPENKPSRPLITGNATTTSPTKSTKSPKAPDTVTTKMFRKVCQSPECITLAHQLLNFRDPSVDPCQDFYEYACGKYTEHTVVDGNGMTKKKKIVYALIEEFLLKNQTTSSKSENAMNILFQKCEEEIKTEDRTLLEKDKWTEAFKIIQSFGKWPILDKNWKESDFNLNKILKESAKQGFSWLGFFAIQVQVDPSFIISPLRSVLGRFKPGVFEQNVRSILKINKIAVDGQLLKNDLKDFETLDKELDDFPLNWESEFIKLEEIQKVVPSVDFEAIMKEYMRPTDDKNKVWSEIKDKVLSIDFPLFFNKTRNLEIILTTTPKRTLANFFLFRLIDLMIGKKPKNCVKDVIGNFPLAALRVFVRNHFDKENLKIATEIVTELRETLLETFQQSTWLHEKTKENAIKKLNMMKQIIGYPEELEVAGALDKKFETLDISPKYSYFKAMRRIDKFQFEQSIDYVSGAMRIKSWDQLLEANAGYFSYRNGLTVNVPLLDDPIFDSTYPRYAKYASIGFPIGHEMGHGFDPKNRKRDGNGDLNDWWTSEDSVEYDKRAQCLVEKYNNYDDPRFGKKLNGTTTLGEISADVIGINLAWKTHKRLLDSDEPIIIGLNDSNADKLFFNIAALTWCSPESTSSLARQLRQFHPTASFRVNGIFSNMESFAETYNCPVGSGMNPKEKCELY